MIKLVILDVDGVMTDGTKVYDREGEVISKRFNDKDFTAIKQLKAANISVCFLSGDRNVNEKIAKDRRIDFYCSLSEDGHLNKKTWLPKLFEKYKTDKQTTVYVGDDYFDLEIINDLTYTFCPFDAPWIVKKNVFKVLYRYGGEGVVVALVETLQDSRLMELFNYNDVVNIDALEKK